MRRVALLALVFVLSQCSSSDEPGVGGARSLTGSECEDACARLAYCGMLPSPLGTSPDDCKTQCNGTHELGQKRVLDCLGDVNPEVSRSIHEIWCGPDETCESASGCLQQIVSDVPISGISDVTLVVVAGEPAAATPDTSSDCIAPACCSAGTVTVADYCAELGISAVSWFAEQRGVRFTPKKARTTAGCERALAYGAVFSGLSSGPFRASVVLEGANASLGAFRWIFYSDPVVLAANQNPKVAVSLPRLSEIQSAQAAAPVDKPFPATPEDSRATCLDGIDNDRDGPKDCAETSCADFCPKAGGADAGTPFAVEAGTNSRSDAAPD